MAQHIAATAKTRFLCVRRFQNKIKDSVYTLIAAQIDNFKSQGFNVMATEIHHVNGSDFTFYGSIIFFLMIRRPPRSTLDRSSAASARRGSGARAASAFRWSSCLADPA